jgi:hypothetical protein
MTTKAEKKAYWNPFADLANGSYNKVHAEADKFIGKNVEVVRDDNVRIQGVLRSVSTCSGGALGLTISTRHVDRWVSPDFKSITIISDVYEAATAVAHVIDREAVVALASEFETLSIEEDKIRRSLTALGQLATAGLVKRLREVVMRKANIVMKLDIRKVD